MCIRDSFRRNPEKRETYGKYFGFRDVYLEHEEAESRSCCWFLLSDIRKIDAPIHARKVGKNAYELPGFRYDNGRLFTYHFIYGGAVFVHSVPESCNRTVLVRAEDEIDSYLKEFFLTKLSEKNLRERAIQQAFAIRLMRSRNWSLKMEEPLRSKRRPDIVFVDENNRLVAVEIKRDDNDDPVTQLRSYIDELKVRHGKKIRGLVVCGRKTEELEASARREGFELLEYSISINL